LSGALDGIDAAAQLRERFDLPIVYLTAHSDDAILRRAQQTLPFGYLSKPFTDSELRSAIELALQRHDLESELRTALYALNEKSALLQAVIEGMEDAVTAVDLRGDVLVHNDAARRIAGPSAAARGLESPSGLYGVFHADQLTPCLPEEAPLFRAMHGETLRHAEFFVRTAANPDGRWHAVNAAPLRDAHGNVCGGVAVERDVTDVKSMQLALQRMSLVDDLTGLHNRRAFQALGAQQLKIAARARRSAALLFVDLDGLKAINDSFGHEEGDLALIDTGRVLRESFRDSDIVARLGGDEFVVLALEVDASRIETVRERLRANIDAFNAKGKRVYRLEMSVGASMFDPSAPQPLEALMAQADARMYEEKARQHGYGTRASGIQIRSA
jgi:diguanylate cyclase (GGDEF)-like protein